MLYLDKMTINSIMDPMRKKKSKSVCKSKSNSRKLEHSVVS